MWWSENDISLLFYSNLKPILDLFPDFGLYSQWEVLFKGDKKAKFVDLAIVEKQEGTKQILGYPRFLFEIKYPTRPTRYKTIMEDIQKDFNRLKRLCTEGCEDIKKEDVIFKGVRIEPKQAYFIFVTDLFDSSLPDPMFSDPHVQVFVSYPKKEKV